VFNALVWTTFFIVGFFTLTVTYGLQRPLVAPGLNVAAPVFMVVGTALTAAAPLTNNAMTRPSAEKLSRRLTRLP